MWDPGLTEVLPDYWPPRPGPVWTWLLTPIRRFYLRRFFGIRSVVVEGLDHLCGEDADGDGILLAPNHSHDSDPHVMMQVARQAGRSFHFMAAWQIFLGHAGLDGFVLQRMGAFSVDREGCDRRAIRTAIEILTSGRNLVVFPEGEVYHLNERLTPLRDGVAFMALAAQRDLVKSGGPGRVRIVPAAIRYRYLEDIRPRLAATMAELEERMMLRTLPGAELPARILRFGEVLLTIKEKERFGHSREGQGDLPSRISHLMETLLERLESAHGNKPHPGESVPVRVKFLRAHLLERCFDGTVPAADRDAARLALDDVHLVLQLYSYPGNYVAERPSVERLAETVDKFEEDLLGAARFKGAREARVILGPPIDLRPLVEAGRNRNATADLTARIERAIASQMAAAGQTGGGPNAPAAASRS